jgi:hypothetical protein
VPGLFELSATGLTHDHIASEFGYDNRGTLFRVVTESPGGPRFRHAHPLVLIVISLVARPVLTHAMTSTV